MGDQTPAEDRDGRVSVAGMESEISRRDLGKGLALLAGGGTAAGAVVGLGSQPTLAAEGHEDWVANGASITTDDGTVSSITFGDPVDLDLDNELAVSWSGFNGGLSELQFEISLRGTDGGDDEEWTGGETATAVTEWVVLAAGTVDSLSLGTSGSEHFTWLEVFDESEPVEVADHPEIQLSDFEAPDDGTTTERELEVQLRVEAPNEGDGVADTAVASALISVTNEEATLSVGGEGSFTIEE